jgi:hypothetical protein
MASSARARAEQAMAWFRGAAVRSNAHKRAAGEPEPGKGEAAAPATVAPSPAEGAREARAGSAAPARRGALGALLSWARRRDQPRAKPSFEQTLAAARARAVKAREARPFGADSTSSTSSSTSSTSSSTSSTSTECVCVVCGGESTAHSTSTSTSCAACSSQARALAAQASASAPLIDPVLLDPILPGEATFAFLRPHCDKAVVYRVESLVDYFLTSGRFQEPETGLRFSEEQLAALDLLAHDSGIRRPSVLAASRDRRTYEERTFKDTALLGLERCCGELVGRLPALLETSNSKDAAQLALLTELFPALRYYYAQLLEADVEFAAQSLAQWARFIEGPPNCPLRCSDPHSLLPAVKDMLDDLASLSLQRATAMT